jgi:hypothetical protein
LAGRGLVAAEDNIALINIAFIERDLKVSRLTATLLPRHLRSLCVTQS